MQTPIMTLAGHGTGPNANATRYVPMAAGAHTVAWTTTDAASATPVAVAGVFSAGVARFPVTVAAGSWTVTLRTGATVAAMADTSVTGTITSGNDLTLTGTATVAAGDYVSWKVVGAGATAQTYLQISALFTATTSGQSMLFFAGATSAAARYLPPSTYISAGIGSPETVAPMPTGGVINSMYVTLSAAPGAGTSKIFTLYKNGSSTAITVTIADAATTGNITAQNISFSKGDTLQIVGTISGVPATSTVQIGCDWVPTISGESLMFGAFFSAQSTTLARYTNASGGVGGGFAAAAEADAYNLAPVTFVAKKLYTTLSTAPGGAASRTQTLRKGLAGTALTAQISGAAVLAEDASNTVSIAAGDLIDFETLPSGTPAADTYMQVSAVAYIAPNSRQSLSLLGVS